MKRLIITAFLLVTGIVSSFAQTSASEALQNAFKKTTDQPTIQTVGFDALFGSGEILFSHENSPVFQVRSEALLCYERGGFLRFRAEAGVATLSDLTEGKSIIGSRFAPNAKVLGGLRFNLNSFRTFLMIYMGFGAYYYPEYGISPSGVMDLRVTHYLTPRIAVNGIFRAGDYSLKHKNLDSESLFGAGISYQF